MYKRDLAIVLIVFLVSRLLVSFLFGLHFQYQALYIYWQYLDVRTLRDHLLRGIWYDHAQPPLFNFLLGLVLKCTGAAAPMAFAAIFKTISLANALLLMTIAKRLIGQGVLPLLLALWYLLSPATLVFECELFYTTFVSFLLLLTCYFLVRLDKSPIKWLDSIGFFLPLTVLCLTRSSYHFLWFFAVAAIVTILLRKRTGAGKLTAVSVPAFLLIIGWYVKNYLIFGVFSTSSWIGMNMARNAFHDTEIKDSTHIEAFHTFLPITAYERFLTHKYDKQFAGLNDRDLLNTYKNDSLMNATHIDYLEVSALYGKASVDYIRHHPAAFLKNTGQSAIIYFSPATRYSTATELQSNHIKFYDFLYSFNLSHFAVGKTQRRIALTASAIPKLLLYCLVIFLFVRETFRRRQIRPVYVFILFTIACLFVLSSLLEHYENMRFRFETEPLFLLLLAAVLCQPPAQQLFKRIFPKKISALFEHAAGHQ